MEQQEFHIQESMSPAELELKYRQAYEKAMAENVALKDENARLKEQLAWFKKAVYGQQSERTEVVLEAPEQLKLFDEAEKEADPRKMRFGNGPHGERKDPGRVGVPPGQAVCAAAFCRSGKMRFLREGRVPG